MPKVNQALVRILENALAAAKDGGFACGGVLLGDKNGKFFHALNAGDFDNYAVLIAGSSVMNFDLIAAMKAMQQQNANRILRVQTGQMPALDS